MIGHRALEARLDFFHLHHVGKEGGDQLEGAARQVIRRCTHLGIAGKERGIMLLQHAGAGARRRHHVIEAGEGGDYLARDGDCVLAVAGIIGRLAAAGLRRRHDHFAAGLLQQLHRGKADGRAEQIDQASDEQTDGDRRRWHHAMAPV